MRTYEAWDTATHVLITVIYIVEYITISYYQQAWNYWKYEVSSNASTVKLFAFYISHFLFKFFAKFRSNAIYIRKIYSTPTLG